jgi:hypothetical protein
MKICFWNIKGLGGRGRRRQLRELMVKQRIDVICVQETMKDHFSVPDLRNLGGGGRIFSGIGLLQEDILGALIGVKQGDLDADEMGEGGFFSWVKIRNRVDDFCWELINVFGPIKKELKPAFYKNCIRRSKGQWACDGGGGGTLT